MAPSAYIVIYDPSGNRVAVLTADGRDGSNNGFLYATWRKRVNDVHMAEFAINANNPDAQYIQDKYEIEIYRVDREVGLTPYVSFAGIIRDDIRYSDDQNRDRIRVRAYGPNSLLARRIVAYPANISGRTAFSSTRAETIMKTLVSRNCVPASIVVGTGERDRMPSALASSFTVQADAAQGNIIDWFCGGRVNLLTELQKIAEVAGGDFDLVRTGFGAYQFRFFANWLGTDRTSGANAIIFATNRGNMANPTLARIRSGEKTMAIVGGQGEETSRIIRTRAGATLSAANDIEMFVDGRNATTTAYLDEIGDQALEDVRFRNALEYDVLQTPIYYVEKDYFLGDRVLAQYAGVSLTQQIYEITFEYQEYRENAAVVMRDL